MKGNFDKAINILTWATEINRENPVVYVVMAMAFDRLGEYDNAIDACGKALELQKDLSLPYWCLGGVYYSKGELEKSAGYYKRAIEIEPAGAAGYLDITKTGEGSRSDIERAFSAFREYLEKYPDDPECRFGAGIIYKSRGEKDKAIENLKYCVASDNDILAELSLEILGEMKE